MDIQVKVANKVASVIGSPVIVCGNSDYNVSFDFDTEWEGLTVKTARFVYKKDGALQFRDVVFSGTVAAVPVLSGIDEVYLGIYAGELHTTTPARILCKQSILCPNPEPQPEPDADVYKQLLEIINNIPVLPTVTERDKGLFLKVNDAGAWVVGGCDEAAQAVSAISALLSGGSVVAKATSATKATRLETAEYKDKALIRGLYACSVTNTGHYQEYTVMLSIENLDFDNFSVGAYYDDTYENGVKYNATTKKVEPYAKNKDNTNSIKVLSVRLITAY